MIALIWTLIGFFCGSLPFSAWIARLALKTDIASIGDGNPGGANVWKAGGRLWAVLAVLLDGFKGATPVGIAYFVINLHGWELIPVALAPLLGHIFSPFLKFRGGKGLSTTFGIWLGTTLWLGPTILGLSLFVWREILKSDHASVIAGLLTLTMAVSVYEHDLVFLSIGLLNSLLLGWSFSRSNNVV
jgi:glycerol-3-phosphate acyltransferase PlsY